MANGEPKLKVTAYVEPVTMRLLVRPAVGEGVAEALRCFAGLLADATRRVSSMLTVYDWEFLALACEAITDDKLRDGEKWADLLLHAISEAHERIHHHEAVWKVDPEGNWKLLRKVVAKLTDLEAVAVLAAVRWYYNQDRESLIAQGWWETHHRVRPKRAKLTAKPRKARR